MLDNSVKVFCIARRRSLPPLRRIWHFGAGPSRLEEYARAAPDGTRVRRTTDDANRDFGKGYQDLQELVRALHALRCARETRPVAPFFRLGRLLPSMRQLDAQGRRSRPRDARFEESLSVLRMYGRGQGQRAVAVCKGAARHCWTECSSPAAAAHGTRIAFATRKQPAQTLSLRESNPPKPPFSRDAQVYYCPAHYRGWLISAHLALETRVVLSHLAHNARPVIMQKAENAFVAPKRRPKKKRRLKI